MPSGIYLACEDEIFFSHHVVPHSNTLHNPLSLSHNQFVSKNIISSTNHYGSRSLGERFKLSTPPLKLICFQISTMRSSTNKYGSRSRRESFSVGNSTLKNLPVSFEEFFHQFHVQHKLVFVWILFSCYFSQSEMIPILSALFSMVVGSRGPASSALIQSD